MQNSIVNLGDSYKYSHSSQYPSNTISMYSYMESRGGLYPSTIFIGLQYYLKEFLTQRVRMHQVEQVRVMANLHGVPFDYAGWKHIVINCNGYLPVRIKAIPEGSNVPTNHVLMTIESTDERVPWIAGFVETLLMKVWYPTTIATKSYYVKQMLEKYGSPEWVQFAYHNFGDRGSSSVESAAIGGMAHLTQFSGTDNFNSLFLAKESYNADMAGFSVFATEHSTTTSYGKDNEEQFVYDQLIANPDAPIMSFVADSYDVYNFTDFCTAPNSRIRKLVESRPHQKFILRPDSGEPIEVLQQMTRIMYHHNSINHTINEESKCLFTDFGILWGDGVTPETIEKILQDVLHRGYAAENFVFGSGGDLMQNVNRDTQRFAIKCSSITTVDNSMMLTSMPPQRVLETIDVYKDPITDPGKKSKRGKVTTYITENGEYTQGTLDNPPKDCTEALQLVFENGRLFNQLTLDEIRTNSKPTIVYSKGDNKYLYLNGSVVPKNVSIGVVTSGKLVLDENIYTYEDLK